MSRVIFARTNSRFSDQDAKLIDKFLRVQFPSGNYTPRAIVDVARPKNSPIHGYFDWDDATAAEKYRLRQARKLITCVVVVIDDGPPVPMSVSVRSDDGRSYWNVQKINQKEIWDSVLLDARQGLFAWEARYKNLQTHMEMHVVFNAIEEVRSWQKRKPSKRRKRKA